MKKKIFYGGTYVKQGKKPTVAQLKWLAAQNLDASVWRITKATSTNTLVCNKLTGETKNLPAIR